MELKELHIKNYKLFKDLEIPKLGQVNLITGKNNTGKTILLEALRIWASRGDASVINNIIWKRGDWDERSEIKTYSSLFNEINIDNVFIYIQDVEIEAYLHGFLETLEGININMILSPKDKKGKYSLGKLKMTDGNKEYPNDLAMFVPASIEFDNKFLWEKIVKERKKAQVIKVLQTIDSKINDIEIIDKQALIGLENTPSLLPLKNFGEGLNRLLTIAMALVSAEDNLLLIDEIDTGLHYSVLEKLWEIIFKYAGELKAQVFVTTHSGDCVNAFSTIANRKEWEGMGNYFRLQWTRDHQRIVPVFYDESELEIAVDQNIETR